MMLPTSLRCDGCGQPASPEHIAKRLRRLEWSTRYRPVHVGTLLLGALAPVNDAEFLYNPAGEFQGEAGLLLEATGISASGKSAEAVLAEFQRGGFFLTHVLECGLEKDTGPDLRASMERRLPATIARVRRSLKPKRVAFISQVPENFIEQLRLSNVGCSFLLDNGGPFVLEGDSGQQSRARLAKSIALPAVVFR